MPEVRLQMSDNVNHPSHYTSGDIECIDAIEAAISHIKDPVAAYLTGQVIKYMWRWELKNGLEDLNKASWYQDRLKKRLDGRKPHLLQEQGEKDL